jgi:hypothetical protein
MIGTKSHDINKPFKVDIIHDAITLSLSCDPRKLALLLMQVSICDELRNQLTRRNPDQVINLRETAPNVDVNGVHDRYYTEYQLRFEDKGGNFEYVPIREWPTLAKKLNLRLRRSTSKHRNIAWEAEEFIRQTAPNKLVYVIKQMLFESLHAATKVPVPKAKQRELERFGSMVDKCWELQPEGKYSPVGMRQWDKEHLERTLRTFMKMTDRERTATYDAVADRIQNIFQFNPVLTGETLRKAVKHHGLDWKQLKAETSITKKKKRKSEE